MRAFIQQARFWGLMALFVVRADYQVFAVDVQSSPVRTERVETVVREFLHAFENLDMPRFIAFFSEDATVFYPMPEPPLRFEGVTAIREQFGRVFASIRKTAVSGPPYHHLRPEDLHIQLIGSDGAIVSFHLRNTERIARRTLVLRKNGEAWQIVHLHASNVPTP
jgi:ketosteroid isomerase-like protein